jgi:hemolysin (HlyC) family protein
MTDSASKPAPAEPAPEPDSSRGPGEGEDRASESWLERLRTTFGLRQSATIREDLADALANDAEMGSFSPEERAMLANILRLRDVRVDDVMVPRADIEAVEINTPLGELLSAFRKSGHSRMPVYRETLDDPIGFVHIKDLMGHVAEAAEVAGDDTGRFARLDLALVNLTRTLAAASLVRNILFVPPSMPVTTLLASMQASRMQLALVIDEYGGTDGLVSLEDVIEMVVGDIEDEHDDHAGPMIVPDGDGIFLADARADLDEVAAAIGADLSRGDEDEDIDTIGGLVFSLIGRIPVRGELISAPGGFEFEILDADPRRIKRLRIYRRPAGAPKPEPRRRPRPPVEPAPDA